MNTGSQLRGRGNRPWKKSVNRNGRGDGWSRIHGEEHKLYRSGVSMLVPWPGKRHRT